MARKPRKSRLRTRKTYPEILECILKETIVFHQNGKAERISVMQAIGRKLWEISVKGDAHAARVYARFHKIRHRSSIEVRFETPDNAVR